MTIEEAVRQLSELAGGNADRIAAYLRDQGISGKRHNAECCPLAQWLTGQTGSTGLSVDGDYVSAPGQGSAWLPDSAAQFVEGFDVGNYPFLDEVLR